MDEPDDITDLISSPVVNEPAIETLDEEDIDYLDGELLEDLTNEEIAAIVGDPYTPPDEIYGPGIAEGGDTVYSFTSLDPSNEAHQGVLNAITNMWQTESGKNTLEFFGWNPNNPYSVPTELITQIAEGSIVSGNEAIESTEDYIGTWDDVGSGEHPMFPEGIEDYYDATDDPFVEPYVAVGGDGSGAPGSYPSGYPSYWNNSSNPYSWWNKYRQRGKEGYAPFAEDYWAKARDPATHPQDIAMYINEMTNMYS